MDQFFSVAAASFVGTLAAIFFARLMSSDAIRGPEQKLAPVRTTPKPVALTLSALFAAVCVLVVHLISTGNMATPLGAIAVVVTFGTLSYAGRTLRR